MWQWGMWWGVSCDKEANTRTFGAKVSAVMFAFNSSQQSGWAESSISFLRNRRIRTKWGYVTRGKWWGVSCDKKSRAQEHLAQKSELGIYIHSGIGGCKITRLWHDDYHQFLWCITLLVCEIQMIINTQIAITECIQLLLLSPELLLWPIERLIDWKTSCIASSHHKLRFHK